MNLPYIIAEVGNNHDGSFHKAKELVYAAKESGADSVKFQCINYSKWIHKDLPVFSRASSTGFKTQLERLLAIQLPLEAYISLAQLCQQIGIDFGCTVFDQEIHDALYPYMAYSKISSGEIHHLPTLKLHSTSAKPVFLSLGLVDSLSTVKRAIDILGSNSLTLLHCESIYPLPPQDACMSQLRYLARTFPNVSTGYSDHTKGLDACLFALGSGAAVIEKHFKLDDTDIVGDKPLSATPSELKRLVDIARIWTRDESSISTAGWSSVSNSQLVRKAHAKRLIQKGERVGWQDFDYLISGSGDYTSMQLSDCHHAMATDTLYPGQAATKETLDINVDNSPTKSPTH